MLIVNVRERRMTNELRQPQTCLLDCYSDDADAAAVDY